MQHDWFADLTGFREASYDATRAQLVVEGHELVSMVNGTRYGIGILDTPALAELRARAACTPTTNSAGARFRSRRSSISSR